jgi:hypothetical protein
MENLDEKIMESFYKKAEFLLVESINFCYSDLPANERGLLLQTIKNLNHEHITIMAKKMADGGSYLVAKRMLCDMLLKARLHAEIDTRRDITLN